MINAFVNGKIIQREPHRKRMATAPKTAETEVIQEFADALSNATTITEIRQAAKILLENTNETEKDV